MEKINYPDRDIGLSGVTGQRNQVYVIFSALYHAGAILIAVMDDDVLHKRQPLISNFSNKYRIFTWQDCIHVP